MNWLLRDLYSESVPCVSGLYVYLCIEANGFFCVIFDEVFFTFSPGSCKTGMYVCFVELVGVSSWWVATTVAIGWKQAMLYIYNL